MFSRIHIYLLLAGIVLCAIPAHCFVIEYYLYTSTAESNSLPVLKILPSGQIVNTGLIYPAGESSPLGFLADQRMLVVANPFPSFTNGFITYKINSDFSLTQLSVSTSTTYAFYINITPNNELILKSTPYDFEIWSIDSMGIITNTENKFLGYFITPVRPQGDIAISPSGGCACDIQVFSIDYNTQSLISTQTILYGGVRKIVYSRDGKMAVGIGYNIGNTFGGDVALLTISSTGSVSTTTTILYLGQDFRDVVFTPDGKYLYLLPYGGSTSASIFTLLLNSTTTTLQDTGKRFQQISGYGFVWSIGNLFQVTPDGKMLVYLYTNSIDNKAWISTAWINDDGSLTWTGYDFPYQSTFGGTFSIFDMIIVPNYITSIPSELWKEYE